MKVENKNTLRSSIKARENRLNKKKNKGRNIKIVNENQEKEINVIKDTKTDDKYLRTRSVNKSF